MSLVDRENSSAISLDQLAALNDEIAALVRAGVPLETGLAQLGHDLPGRLGKVTERLADRMQSGASLEQALGEEGSRMPDVYCTLVKAGVRSGRLAVVLEGVAETARRLDELRRASGLALFYPVLLTALGIGLFAFFVSVLAPSVVAIELPGSEILQALRPLKSNAVWWGTIGPAVIVLGTIAWWIVSRRSSVLDHQRLSRPLAWLPIVGKLRYTSRAAIASEVLRLLTEHDVPLDEAILLSGEASGDPNLTKATQEIAAAIERGEPLTDPVRGPLPQVNQLPPLLRVAVLSGGNQARLVRAATNAAEVYRERSRSLLVSSRQTLPIILTVVVGFCIAAVFALTMFVPYVQILHGLLNE